MRTPKSKIPPPKNGRSDLWLFLILGLLTLIVYSNSFSAGLVFDNATAIGNDPRLRAITVTNLEKIFTENYWWPSQESLVYRPVTTLSYLFNYTILGNRENVAGYHAVNFLLHWFNAWFVFLIVRRLARRLDIAALSACLFAAHPVNTEAVTNIVGRADLIATFCVLFGGWCYLRSVEAGTGKAVWLIMLGAASSIGVLAKENAVMLIAFLGLYDFLWRWPPKPIKKFAPAYFAVTPGLVLILFVRRWMLYKTPVFGQVFVDNPIAGAAPFQGVMTALNVFGRYMAMLVFPRTLSSDYSFNQIPVFGAAGNSWNDAEAWLSFAIIAALVIAAFWWRKREPLFSWGVLFFVVMMLPTANLLMTIGSIMAERFLYLPSIGFCSVAALAVCKIGERRRMPRYALPTLAIVIIGALGLRTYARNADWHDDLSLWTSTLAASPNSFKSHQNFAAATLSSEHALDKAIHEAEIAQSILDPLPPEQQTNIVYLDLGRYYLMKGEYLKSVDVLEKARSLDHFANEASRKFRLAQGVPPEKIADVGNLIVYQLLGAAYSKLERWKDCEAAGRYLQHMVPDEPSGYLIVGNAYFNMGRFQEAAVEYVAGLLIDPGNLEMSKNLKTIHVAMGLPDAAGLNTAIPLIRQEVDQAAATVVHLFEEAKQGDRAQEFRERFFKENSVPPELLKPAP